MHMPDRPLSFHQPWIVQCSYPAVFGIKQRKVVNFCASFILLWQRQVDENNLNVNVHNTFCKADFVPQSFPYFMGAAHPTSSQSTYTQCSTHNCRVLSQSFLKLETFDKIYRGPLITRILELEKIVLCKIRRSGSVLKTQLTQKSPTSVYLR